jgi:hypothetical protein
MYNVFNNPSGIGFYLRGLSKSKHGTPAQAAKKAKDHGVSFVAIMSLWQEYKNNKFRQMMSNGRDAEIIWRYADAFQAQEVDVWLWGFPWGGHEQAAVDRFQHVTEVCDGTIDGWLWDPELGYKWSSNKKQAPVGMRGQPEYTSGVSATGVAAVRKKQARSLVNLSLDAMTESLNIGITSYGMAPGHRNFPWSEFGGVGFGSPQLYSVGPKDIDRGISAWRKLGWSNIVPSVPTFGKNSGAHLHNHLSNFVDGEEYVNGFIFWSWRQTHGSENEWNIIHRWSDWLERGVCNI